MLGSGSRVKKKAQGFNPDYMSVKARIIEARFDAFIQYNASADYVMQILFLR